MKTVFLSFWLVFLGLGSIRAELALEVPVIEVKPKPEDEEITTTFVFHNNGGKPVTVLKLDSSCSCLSADMDKRVYGPGEKGVGKAVFKISSFVGRHEKTLHVVTDDPAQPEWVVPFVIEVPAVVDIEPKNLQWWLGDPADPKKYVVKMTGDQPMKILKITTTRPKVEFSMKEVKPGREYEVTLKPLTTDEVMLGALTFETDSTIPKYQRQMAFYSVYRKPADNAAAQP
jgi:hypothetical protein